jgi:hypothetical protein
MPIGWPKMLYLQGDRTKRNVVVKTPEEETAKRAEGFRMIDPKLNEQAVAELAAAMERAKPADATDAPKTGGRSRK